LFILGSIEILRFEDLSALVEATLAANAVGHLHGSTVRACYEVGDSKFAVDWVSATSTCLWVLILGYCHGYCGSL